MPCSKSFTGSLSHRASISTASLLPLHSTNTDLLIVPAPPKFTPLPRAFSSLSAQSAACHSLESQVLAPFILDVLGRLPGCTCAAPRGRCVATCAPQSRYHVGLARLAWGLCTPLSINKEGLVEISDSLFFSSSVACGSNHGIGIQSLLPVCFLFWMDQTIL